jgi:Domain of unknown function (DUF4352)
MLRGLALALVLGLAACSTTTDRDDPDSVEPPLPATPTNEGPPTLSTVEPDVAPTPSAVGDTVAFTDEFGSVGAITLHSVDRVQQPPDSIFEAPDSGSYLVIEVTVEAEAGDVSANPFNFRLQDEAGHTYEYSDGADEAIDDPVDSAPIAPGRKVRGFVGFDAPEGKFLLDYGLGGLPLATFSISG